MTTKLMISVKGDSGSWVIRDGKVCGHIVDARDSLPMAYMIPMHQILRDISKGETFKEVSICNSSHLHSITAPSNDWVPLRRQVMSDDSEKGQYGQEDVSTQKSLGSKEVYNGNSAKTKPNSQFFRGSSSGTPRVVAIIVLLMIDQFLLALDLSMTPAVLSELGSILDVSAPTYTWIASASYLAGAITIQPW
ncbi:hypothetical protein MMC17_006331, partial [Xylographa soralifera]|nr:hypothetical protein [Xylographa soralifera]